MGVRPLEGFPGHGGDLRWAAARYGRHDFLDLSCSLNPLGPPGPSVRAARRSVRRSSRYPDPSADPLKVDLSRWLGVDFEELLLGNGSTELIHHLVLHLRPRSMLMVEPCFSEYRKAAQRAGCRVESYLLRPEEGFPLRLDHLVARLDEGYDLLVLVNPSSVTGKLYEEREIVELAAASAERGTLVLLDESFMGFCLDPQALTLRARWVPKFGNVVRLSTSTKLFALAGLRGPGWLAGPRDLVRQLEEALPPWRVGEPAAAALRAALRDRGYLERTRRLVPRWRRLLEDGLREFPLQLYPSQANFILLRSGRGDEAYGLVEHLGRRGILVRWCADFLGLGPQFIRVAVARPRHIRRLLREVRSYYERAGNLPGR